MRVVLRPAAETDLEHAAAWYEQQRSGLGSDFMDAVRERLRGIHENPQAYPVVFKTVRRALLHGFPYGLFYVTEPDRIVVIGCFHARQSPRRWTKRS